jgi:predicted N-formylglutamate amidohydrolase
LAAYLENKILIIVDHASNFIPKENNKLGLSNSFLNKHIAFDIGVKELSLDLSNRLKCKVIQGKYSRLLIDLNRDLNDPTVIPEIVDGKIIPGNIGLSKSEIRLRVKKIYNKYHHEINRTIKNKKVKVILSLHSFNPIFKNKRRLLEFGILSNEDKNLSSIIIDQLKLQKLNVGDNKPYRGNLIGDSMYRHGLKNKLPHALIEVRNDLLSNPTKIKRVSRLLHKTVVKSLKKLTS